MGKRGQVAMEYVILVGFLMVLSIPLVIIFTENSRSVTDQVSTNQAYSIGKKIIGTAETVAALGTPSKSTVTLNFPAGITAITVGPRSIVFNMSSGKYKTQVEVVSAMNITGSLNPAQGQKDVTIEALPGVVQITT